MQSTTLAPPSWAASRRRFTDVRGFSKSCHRAKQRQWPGIRASDTSKVRLMASFTVFKHVVQDEARADSQINRQTKKILRVALAQLCGTAKVRIVLVCSPEACGYSFLDI